MPLLRSRLVDLPGQHPEIRVGHLVLTRQNKTTSALVLLNMTVKLRKAINILTL